MLCRLLLPHQAVSLDTPVPPSDFDEEKKEPDGTTESNDALNAFFLEAGIDASLIYSAPAEQKIVRPDQFVQLVKTLERVKKASFTVKDRNARQNKRISIPANIVTHQAMIRAWVKELKMVNELLEADMAIKAAEEDLKLLVRNENSGLAEVVGENPIRRKKRSHGETTSGKITVYAKTLNHESVAIFIPPHSPVKLLHMMLAQVTVAARVLQATITVRRRGVRR